MKAGWIVIVVLLLVALGWATGDMTHRIFAPAPADGSVQSVVAITQQTEQPELPPQIRTRETAFAFPGQAQAESTSGTEASARGYVIAAGQQSAIILFAPLPVTLDNAAPFLALSAIWDSDVADEARLTVSVRSSVDGNVWGEWQRSSLDGDPRTKSGLFFLPAATLFIQYRVEMERNPRGVSPLISGIRFRFISPGATTKRMYEAMRRQPQFADSRSGRYQPQALGGLFPQPAVVSRTGWGCPDGDKPHRGSPSYTTVTHLIVHHTATGNDATDWPAVVRSIWNFHVFTNGWSDIGYNYLIDSDGFIYEGRAGGDNVLGSHFSCANTGTMGTALLGNFTAVQPTEKTSESLSYLLSWKSDQRGLNPLGITFHASTQLNLPVIAGHRDANGTTVSYACAGTECPGNSLYPLLPQIKTTVAGYVDPANDFSLAAAQSAISVQAGSSNSLAITTTTVKGNAQSLQLEISGLPDGVTANLNPRTVISGSGATLTLNAAASVSGGSWPVSVIARGSTIRAYQLNLSVTGTMAVVSAASFQNGPVAREGVVAAFGSQLAPVTASADSIPLPESLAGVSVQVTDRFGDQRTAPLFFVSPQQINYQIPPGTATGTATVTVKNNNAVTATGTLQIVDVAPAFFTANSDGTGVPAAFILRVKADDSQSIAPVAQFDQTQNRFVPLPIDLAAEDEQVFLVLFGTGVRFRTSQEAVSVKIGGMAVPVLYAGPQNDFAGLDQINVQLPAVLRGRGEAETEVLVDGQPANITRVAFK